MFYAPVSNINPVLQMNLRLSSARAHRDNAMGWLYRVFGSNVNTILWAIGDMLGLGLGLRGGGIAPGLPRRARAGEGGRSIALLTAAP